MADAHVLVICGAAGVGKSTVAYEVGRQLAERDVAHAFIDSDELDRVHPWPPPGRSPSDLSRRNLAALWANYAAAGHHRLLVTGVFASLAEELAWIAAAVPDADLTPVRLTADLDTLTARVRRREIGSGAAAQLSRTRRQLEEIRRSDPPHTPTIDTSHRSVVATATLIISRWLAAGAAEAVGTAARTPDPGHAPE